MAGRPAKRAKESAARAALVEAKEEAQAGATPPLTSLVPYRPLQELVEAGPREDFTHTALKRAMRKRAGEHAEAAIAVLVENLTNKDPKVAMDAANKLLEWGLGKPTQEIEAGEGLQIAIVKFNQ